MSGGLFQAMVEAGKQTILETAFNRVNAFQQTPYGPTGRLTPSVAEGVARACLLAGLREALRRGPSEGMTAAGNEQCDRFGVTTEQPTVLSLDMWDAMFSTLIQEAERG